MIRKFTINPPFAHQAGDVYAREGNTIRQIRGGIQIDIRTVGPPSQLTAQVHVGGSNVTEFFEEQRMPGQNVSMTGVEENQANGSVTLKYSSGNQNEYASWAAVGQIADSLDASPDFAEKILALKAFRASPDGANKTTQVGAQVSVNGLADQPIVYTEPQ